MVISPDWRMGEGQVVLVDESVGNVQDDVLSFGNLQHHGLFFGDLKRPVIIVGFS